MHLYRKEWTDTPAVAIFGSRSKLLILSKAYPVGKNRVCGYLSQRHYPKGSSSRMIGASISADSRLTLICCKSAWAGICIFERHFTAKSAVIVDQSVSRSYWSQRQMVSNLRWPEIQPGQRPFFAFCRCRQVSRILDPLGKTWGCE